MSNIILKTISTFPFPAATPTLSSLPPNPLPEPPDRGSRNTHKSFTLFQSPMAPETRNKSSKPTKLQKAEIKVQIVPVKADSSSESEEAPPQHLELDNGGSDSGSDSDSSIHLQHNREHPFTKFPNHFPISKTPKHKPLKICTDVGIYSNKPSNTTSDDNICEILRNRDYDSKFPFNIDIDSFPIPKGLSHETIRSILTLKSEPDWMLNFCLHAFEKFSKRKEPNWSDNSYPSINFQDICYYSAPKKKPSLNSLEEADTELLRYFNKLCVLLNEKNRFATVAVDVVLDSGAIATTHRKTLVKAGANFCSISEAIRKYPDLVKKYFGKFVPSEDNYYAVLIPNTDPYDSGPPKSLLTVSTMFSVSHPRHCRFGYGLTLTEDTMSITNSIYTNIEDFLLFSFGEANSYCSKVMLIISHNLLSACENMGSATNCTDKKNDSVPCRQMGVTGQRNYFCPHWSVKAVDVLEAANILRYYAGAADKIHGEMFKTSRNLHLYTLMELIGVVGHIIHWNFLTVMFFTKVAPSLDAGCTMVLKPAEQTPLSALFYAHLANEDGSPNGVLNVVPGFGATAGVAITSHMDIDAFSFTGSAEMGCRVMQAAASSNLKPVSLELGGKSPVIVFYDADVDKAVDLALFGILHNKGEVCIAFSRVFVQEGIYDEFEKKVVEKVKHWVVGDPFNPEVQQGPQTSKVQFDKILMKERAFENHISSNASSLGWMEKISSNVINKMLVLLSSACGLWFGSCNLPLPGHNYVAENTLKERRKIQQSNANPAIKISILVPPKGHVQVAPVAKHQHIEKVEPLVPQVQAETSLFQHCFMTFYKVVRSFELQSEWNSIVIELGFH
ncbi:uncharacterized protein LOC131613996 [Vicia villosa]|uniref:uncharacterized protein LOC131613996 n=1 Tax=Vicia villosa TaxID=3911 RepID=UPI00273AE4A1|nr:uncharacterized protein LOC131613996 [Vicia villosa]